MTRLLTKNALLVAATALTLAACGETKINISLSPAGPLRVAPKQVVDVTATGASNLHFRLSVNASGATITDGGHYVAGAKGDTEDVVTVDDGAGHTASVTIDVGPGVTVTAPVSSVLPAGTVQFAASGGSNTGYVWSLSTNLSGGTIDAATGVYTAGATGGSNDVIKAVDSLGNEGTKSIAVTTVTALALSPKTATVAPRGTVAFSATGGSGTKTFAITTNGSGGTIDSATGAYAAGTTGDTSDVITVTDGVGATDTATVTVGAGVTVAGVPDTDPAVLPGGTIQLSASGGNGIYTWSISTNASSSTIDQTGLYTAGATGSVTDVVTATDSLGNTGTASIAVGQSPVALALLGVGTVSPKGTLTLSATGGSGAGYAFSFVTNRSGGTLDAATGVYVAGDTGSVLDDVKVTDSASGVATGSITVGAGVTITGGTSAAPGETLTLTGHGGSGTGYSFTLSTNQSGGNVTSAGVYTAGDTGLSNDVVTATDSLGNSGTVTIAVGVPVFVTNPVSGSVGPLFTRTFTASGGKSPYTWTLTTNGSGGSINSSTGAYAAGATEKTSDVVKVTDAVGKTASTTISIGATLSITGAVSAYPRQTSLQFNAAGGSGTVQTWSVDVNNSGGSITGAGVYTAGATPNKIDTIKAVDTFGNSATADISVGAGVSITNLPETNLAPGATYTFVAAGGSGAGYVFATVNAGSGGSFGQGGAYTAGTTGGTTDQLKVTDSAGNTASFSVGIGAAVSIDAVSPLEAGSPSVQLTAHGGTGSYTFSFVTNASGGTVSTSGLYAPGLTGPVTDVVKVTDGFTSAQTSISVLAFSGIVLSPSSATLAPGTSVDVSIIGGVAPYTVDWIEGGDSSDGVITADGSAQFKYKVGFAGAAEGTTDTLKVTDSTAGTPKSATFVVTVTPALAISGPTEVSPSQIVTYTTTGGAASSTYSWSFANGETDSSLGDSNSSTETYYASPTGNFTETIIVTESPSGATASIDVTIGAPLELISPFGDATVFPRAQGTFTATGGSGTYTFSFQLNEDAHVVGNLSGGTMTADGQYQAGPIGDVTDVVQVTDGIVTRYASIPLGEALQLVGAPTSTPPNSPGFQLSTTGGTGDVSLQLLPVLAGGDCSTGLASAGSGGQIVEGIYYAGPVGNSIDRLVATDANGATATACVNVGPGVYLLNQAGDLFTNNEISIGPGETFTFIVGGGTGLYDFIGPDTNNSDATVAETDTPLTFTYTSGFACSSPQGGVKRKATRDVRAEARLARSVRKSAGPAIAPGGDNTGCDDLLVAVDNYGNEADLTVHVGPRLELAITPTIVKQGGTGFVTAVGGIASLPVDYSLGDLQGSGDGRALIPAESNRNVTFQAGHTGSPSDDFPIYDEVDGQEESTGALASVSVQIGLALQIGDPFGDSTLVPGQTVSLTLYGGQCSAVFGPCDDGVQDAFNWSADSGLIVSNSTLQTVQWKLDPDVGGTSVNISTSDGLGNSASLSVSVGDILSFGCDGPCNTSPNATLSLTDYTGGGAPAYTYAFVINNSGGTVTPDGTYTVGPTGDTTDTLSVTDQFGTQRNVTFNVGAALGVFFDSGANVAPGGTAALNIQGGQGPYTAAVTTDNSGNDTLGSVHPAVGVSGNALTYTAGGGIDGTADDVITVTDAIGAKATATLHVSQRLQVAVDTNSTTLGGEAFITLSGGSANTAAFALKSNSDGSGGSKVSGSGTSFLYTAGAGHAAASFDTLTFTDGFGQNSVVINVAPSTASQQISFVTAAASTSTTTTLSNVSIDGAFVTYVKPATSGEGLGWFIQGDLDGPALFIDNQKGTLTQPSVGDVQSLTLGTVAVVYSASQANVAIVPASVVKTSSGASTASLVTNLTDTSGNVLVDPSTLLSTFPYPLESKLVYVHSQVASSGTAGTGYPAFTFGAFGNVGTVKMRTTDAVQIATGLITGCTVDLGPTPLWHNGNRTAEPSAWTTADLVVSGCPSFNVASSPAAGATGVASASQIVLTFDTPMNISTVTYNTSGAAAACGTDSLQITTGGNCISGALAWSADQKTATFTPGAPLTAGATYAIALTSAVKSNNGSGLSSSFNPTFTVASGVQACTADTPTNLANLHGALVLSQVYGGGGNSGATYANDFVELHNRGTTAITLNGVSVQFAGTTASSAYSVVALPTGTIVPGGYYLIALHRSSSTGAALPTPDFVPPNVSIAAGSGADTSTDITQANGKIALVNGSTVLATGACSGANLLDLIGYGTASCSEGTGTATAALSSTKSATRKNDPSGSAFGCVDTDSNSADFTVGTPSARNSASSAAVCVCAAP